MSTPQVICEFTGSYRWLSNFWPSPIKIGTTAFPTVEHAYQYEKCLSVIEADQKHNMALGERILNARTPGEAKKLGRRAKVQAGWWNRRLGVMHILVLAKYDQNEELGAMLLSTKDADLYEGNRWGDAFWGVDLTKPPADGKFFHGENWLGRITMIVRSEIAVFSDNQTDF